MSKSFSKLFPVLKSCLYLFPSLLLVVHRMSAEEVYGDESPVLDNLQVDMDQEAPKKKGGRTKEKKNACGIPEAIRNNFGYDTPAEETKQERKIKLQGI